MYCLYNPWNVKKPEAFWRFLGVQNRIIGLKGFNTLTTTLDIFLPIETRFPDYQ